MSFSPSLYEQQNFAEFNTPFALRQVMLDFIPDIFWNKPRKVFEPCVGKGGFLMDIIERFMKGLEKSIPDKNKRYETIIKDCIYFADINKNNVNHCIELIRGATQPPKTPGNKGARGKPPKIKTNDINYFVGDVLKLKTGKYDAIITNPPYNASVIKSGRKYCGSAIWKNFVEYFLDILNENGLLLIVHPPLWRKHNHKLNSLYLDNQIHYLSINNRTKGKKVFNAETYFDYYLLEKTKPYTTTFIQFDDNKIYELDLMKYSNNPYFYIPNHSWDIFEKVFKKEAPKNNLLQVYKNGHNHKNVSNEKNSEYRFPTIHTLKGDEPLIKYAKNPHIHQYEKKVVISRSNPTPYYVSSGGITDNAMYILVDNKKEGDRIIKKLTSEVAKTIIDASKYSSFEIFPFVIELCLFAL